MDKLTTPTSRTSALSSPRFAAGLIGLHWLTLLLIAAVYALMEFKGIYPKGSAGREAMAQWHFTLGMTVLAVTAVRLLVAWQPAPAHRAAPAAGRSCWPGP